MSLRASRGAGEATAVGDGVTDVAPGARVVGVDIGGGARGTGQAAVRMAKHLRLPGRARRMMQKPATIAGP